MTTRRTSSAAAGSRQAKFSLSADATVKQFVARRAENPNHVRFAVLHFSPYTVPAVLRTMGQFNDARFPARLASDRQQRELATYPSHYAAVSCWSPLVVDATDSRVPSMESSALLSGCDLGASVRAVTPITSRRGDLKMLPTYPTVATCARDVRLFSASQPSNSRLTPERAVTLIRALGSELYPATLTE